MIAKTEWFNRRRYTGWGLTPKTWQGVVYIIVFVAITMGIQNLPFSEPVKIVVMALWIILFLIDILHVMASMKLDEREQKVEAIAERNASWTMVATTVLAALYVSTLGQNLTGVEFMPIVISPIVTGVIAKGITNFLLDRREV